MLHRRLPGATAVFTVPCGVVGVAYAGAKRDDYVALGVGEYWRCDDTGEHYEAKLAGERLMHGEYVP